MNINLSHVSPQLCKLYPFPVYCTPEVWEVIQRAVSNGQSLSDVLHHIFMMADLVARAFKTHTTEVLFTVDIPDSGHKQRHNFKMSFVEDAGEFSYLLELAGEAQ